MYPAKKPFRRRGLWAALITLVVVAVVCGLLIYSRFELFLQIRGESEIVLDYGTSFFDPGADVVFRAPRFQEGDIILNTRVQREGEVDASTVGTYSLEYSAGFLFFRIRDTRTVTVVDRVAPEITLVADSEYLTLPGEPYQEEGFTAWDEYDGDITDRVIRREENGVVYYSVSDSSGNIREITRQIQYVDVVPPEIVLEGESEIRIGLGSLYVDPGFTAMDDRDGDLTELVSVEGTVDQRTVGTYTITYTVSDESGNETVITRTVHVETATPPEQVLPEGKVIYLTFDDGPCYYTDWLLDILAKYDVKATFFVIGNNTEMMQRIVEEGHSIGIHTVSHNYRKVYSSEEAFFEEVYQMQDAIYEATGHWTTLIRFPGGSSNTVSSFNEGIMSRLTRLVQEHGFQYFDWNVDSNDAGGAKTSQEVYENVINGAAWTKHSVVLQHDIKDFSIEAVERIIQWGLNHGYTFLPLEPTSPSCHHGVNN